VVPGAFVIFVFLRSIESMVKMVKALQAMVFQHQEMNHGLMVALVEKGVTLILQKGMLAKPIKIKQLNWFIKKEMKVKHFCH
jgi:hypothetical protein